MALGTTSSPANLGLESLTGSRNMPRYYLDLYNGDGLTVDREGQVFDTRERLRREAIRILPDIVRDEILEADRTAITVKVRDEDGRQVFEASLVVSSGWCD
ncbi:DUF6894 family protein [Mesorhizobium newzealandense]|uniref:DUF6894 family protein n=1 Tax=Mesorhizobium newzealandense TaxID=1300302 RepID=A0ABW4U7B1_9HYPH